MMVRVIVKQHPEDIADTIIYVGELVEETEKSLTLRLKTATLTVVKSENVTMEAL